MQLRVRALDLRPNAHGTATARWGPNTMGMDIKTGPYSGTLTLRYKIVQRGHDDKIVEDVVPLVPTALYRGGRNWYFRCPACDRRCKILYWPPGAQRFGCRRCLNLAYRSSQRHNKTLDKYKRLWKYAPETLLEMAKAGNFGAVMALLEFSDWL